MQACTSDGLRPQEAHSRRCTIIPILNTNENLVRYLISMWAEKAPHEAYDALSLPDVEVTNSSDKLEQLPKIKHFSALVVNAVTNANEPSLLIVNA